MERRNRITTALPLRNGAAAALTGELNGNETHNSSSLMPSAGGSVVNSACRCLRSMFFGVSSSRKIFPQALHVVRSFHWFEPFSVVSVCAHRACTSGFVTGEVSVVVLLCEPAASADPELLAAEAGARRVVRG